MDDLNKGKLQLESRCEKYEQEIKLLNDKCQEQHKLMVCITLNIRILLSNISGIYMYHCPYYVFTCIILPNFYFTLVF